MFTEMESLWAGDGRGVVMQKIFSKDGTLLATAIQEVSSTRQLPIPRTALPIHIVLPSLISNEAPCFLGVSFFLLVWVIQLVLSYPTGSSAAAY